MSSFVHLHNHSHYSLLDGACRINDLVSCAAKLNMPALALTDHGNMFGAIEFYRTAKVAGIKPIIGVETYVAPRSRKDKAKSDHGDNSYHLLLLAKDQTGYRNLMKLVSIGFLEGFYYRPRIDHEVLKECHEGIIAMSACLKGEVSQAIVKGNMELAKTRAEAYRDIFGDDFYLEMQNHKIEEEKTAAEGLQYLSKELDIPLAITNDIHYMKREHHMPHDALICIQTGKEMDDPDRLKFRTEELYFKSEEEMRELFSDHQDALDITGEIAEKCNLLLDFHDTYLPSFEIPGESKSKNLDEYLRELAWKGLQERYDNITPEIEERFEFELGVINHMGFPGYFLIVNDFIDFARSKGIPVGPGRGSVAGSIVSYALGITNLDPLKYNLLFERFLNPERVSLPDIDIDFCYERREEVIDYVREKYGEKNVAQIITFGTMAARAVIRDVGRVLNVKYGDVDRIAKMIPFGSSIEEARRDVKEFGALFESDDEQYQKLLEYSKALEGIARHASTHAAGVVITPEELTNYVPLYLSNTGDVTTQYDMKCVEKIGLLKMDFLGLRTLTVLDNATKMLRERGIEIDLDHIPLDDEKTYELFGKGETTGFFQFESGGMRDYLKKLNPSRIEDLIAMNALYRPGPMKMIDDFIHCSHGRQDSEYLHPLLEPILKETHGIIVYQEQVMQIASVMGGFSLGEADLLRRAMGKKEKELMGQQEVKFVAGADQKGIDKLVAKKVFDLMFEFVKYGFNKSHAACYSIIAYQTAYLKAHYPAEFMAATLTSEMGNSDRVMILLDECKRLGLRILPPCVNESFASFTVHGDSIRFGLGAIKNAGKGAIQSIIRAREKHGGFKSIFDFVQNLDLRSVNKKVLESLAKAGAMDSFPGTRAHQFSAVETAVNFAQNEQSNSMKGQFNIFDANGGKDARAAPSHGYPSLPEVEPWSQSLQLSYERELLGFYVSGHPLDKYHDEVHAFSSIHLSNLKALPDGSPIKTGGIISNIKTILDKSGRKMAFITLEDFTGSAEALVFASVYERYESLIEQDGLVLLTGKVSTQENKEPNIVSERVISLSDARKKLTRNVCMNLSLDDLNDEKLKSVEKLVSSHDGKCEFLIHLINGGKKEYVVRSKKYKVSPDTELLLGLKEIVGEENVWIEGE
jgi:DNA polymerase-3 subunit alpha